ncbi:MAG: corrinoid protein [Ardenticatenaceae bacterium]|nr:corrinoid protein [Ardenticatenaceae bacterium]HBY93019.1 Corrinoid methyltransferase [Chloroflexota bacterium]
MSKEELFPKLSDAVLAGDEETVLSLCQQAVSAGFAPMSIITDGMAPGARAAGDKFSQGKYFLPQLIMAGEAMKAGLEVLLPLITAEARQGAAGRVVIGSVEGDVHDVGKNIVAAMLTAGGFDVVDLGVDVSAAAFVDAVRKESPDILGMGSYMSTTRPQMQVVIEALKEASLRDRVRVMIGGIAATETYAREIGADGFAADAPDAVRLAEQLAEGVAAAPTLEAGASPWRGFTLQQEQQLGGA